jgi:adenylylsulfate kinase
MVIIQLTGLSGAGKTSISHIVQRKLYNMGIPVEVLDGDEYRQNLCRDLGFSKSDREENIRRLGFVAHVLARNGIIAIIAAINPYENARAALRQQYPSVKTVWIKCSLPILQERDTKGLYKRASLPPSHPDYLQNLTGVNDPYEMPAVCDLIIHTDSDALEQSAGILIDFILKNFIAGV